MMTNQPDYNLLAEVRGRCLDTPPPQPQPPAKAVRLTPEERQQIRDNITLSAMAINPMTCKALLSLLDDRDEQERELVSIRLELAHMRDTDAIQDRQALLENNAALEVRVADLEASLTEMSDRVRRQQLQAEGDGPEGPSQGRE